MFKHNKLRYWLGLPCVVYTKGMYSISRLGLGDRTYLDQKEQYWWHGIHEYVGLYKTPEEAYDKYILITEEHKKQKEFSKVRPV